MATRETGAYLTEYVEDTKDESARAAEAFGNNAG